MMAPLPYQNPSLSPDERTRDLLPRMNLREKVGQMLQRNGQHDLNELVLEIGVGSLLHCNGDRSAEAIRLASLTRLGIPLLIGDDCIHGHSFWPGATIFPTQLAQACSWNEDLIAEAAAVTAREVSGTGVHWTFSPVLCLTRDLRWGRVGETFGEDPTLITRFATAMIRGYQGGGLDDPQAILATAKHYAGYSETLGGRDASEADISRRKLRSFFLPPFEAAARSGCMSFMIGYQSMDGIPATANTWLLKDVLRDEWGFEGILVTDWNNVGNLVTDQKIAANLAEAATIAVRSGNDLIMSTPGFLEGAMEAVSTGLMSELEIDEVVSRILLLKFRMGLFENPRGPDKGVQACIGCEDHRKINLELARESIVLLQNKNGILPLSPDKPLRIALVGPNANDEHTQLGDWAGASGQMTPELHTHPRECTVTLLDGLRETSPACWTVDHAPGCRIGDAADDLLAPALKVAKAADVIIAAVGDHIGLVGE